MNTKKERPNKQEATYKLMQFCSRKERSSKEVEKKLNEWGLASHAGSILAKLREEGFLDDERFVKAFVSDKTRINHWGKIKIRYQLKVYGIDEKTIDNIFNSFDDEEYINMIFNELSKKLKSIQSNHPRQKKTKLYAFGNQRGYESEYIYQYLRDQHLL